MLKNKIQNAESEQIVTKKGFRVHKNVCKKTSNNLDLGVIFFITGFKWFFIVKESSEKKFCEESFFFLSS